MVCMMLFFYLISILPSGIFVLLGGILGKDFQENVFFHISLLFDVVYMLICHMNFFFLICMSHSFRKTFLIIFWPWTDKV